MESTARSSRMIRTGGVIVALALAAAATTSSLAAAPGRIGSGRVDLERPTFSDPTDITNPLFPVNDVEQVIQLGSEGDVALRHEITLLERTKVVTWNGERIEAVVSQFVAYGDGELLEVAVDYFAQADDGSVWYLGEDVDNYENGVISDHDGTWLAGRDGPAGMIMPADPQIGDVYRPENIPGLVFEEVTVQETGVALPGPTGPVTGAIRVQERLLDGTLEDKTFAPGYGEFIASVPSSDEYVEVAVAVPTDGNTRLVPPLLAAEAKRALATLDAAITAHDSAATRQAVITVGQATADLSMLFAGIDRVDDTRVSLWRDQLAVDRAAGDTVGVASDRAIIRAIRARTNR